MLTTPCLIGYGSPDNIAGSGYTTFGSLAAITTGVADPFGGTGAYTLNDTDGANVSARYKSGIVPSQAAGSVNGVFVKAGTSAQSYIRLFDDTATSVDIRLDIAWSGGVPTITAANGSLVGTLAVGSGWYLPLSTAVLARGNSHSLDLRPATATGSCSFYVRNVCVFDLFDDAMSWDEDAEGSSYEKGPNGFRDTYRTGLDYLLEGKLRNIPQQVTSYPDLKSGWYGENESVGVNCGVQAMLRAGREGQTLRWAPDRSACSTSQDCTLEGPVKEKPETEDSSLRRVLLRLRSSSVFVGV